MFLFEFLLKHSTTDENILDKDQIEHFIDTNPSLQKSFNEIILKYYTNQKIGKFPLRNLFRSHLMSYVNKNAKEIGIEQDNLTEEYLLNYVLIDSEINPLLNGKISYDLLLKNLHVVVDFIYNYMEVNHSYESQMIELDDWLKDKPEIQQDLYKTILKLPEEKLKAALERNSYMLEKYIHLHKGDVFKPLQEFIDEIEVRTTTRLKDIFLLTPTQTVPYANLVAKNIYNQIAYYEMEDYPEFYTNTVKFLGENRHIYEAMVALIGENFKNGTLYSNVFINQYPSILEKLCWDVIHEFDPETAQKAVKVMLSVPGRSEDAFNKLKNITEKVVTTYPDLLAIYFYNIFTNFSYVKDNFTEKKYLEFSTWLDNHQPVEEKLYVIFNKAIRETNEKLIRRLAESSSSGQSFAARFIQENIQIFAKAFPNINILIYAIHQVKGNRFMYMGLTHWQELIKIRVNDLTEHTIKTLALECISDRLQDRKKLDILYDVIKLKISRLTTQTIKEIVLAFIDMDYGFHYYNTLIHGTIGASVEDKYSQVVKIMVDLLGRNLYRLTNRDIAEVHEYLTKTFGNEKVVKIILVGLFGRERLLKAFSQKYGSAVKKQIPYHAKMVKRDWI
jgi:hypothetical protein